MNKNIVLTIALLAFFSCGYRNIKNGVIIPKGTYKGKFGRSSPLARYAASNVTVTFVENTFVGESDKEKYPAICKGTFKVSADNIEFANECMWTADFDWSYILKGKYNFTLADGKLEMTRSLGDTTDHYSLMLQ